MARKVPLNRLSRTIAAVGLCLVLSACENSWLEDAPSLETMLSTGWLFGAIGAEAPPKPAQPVYCYETIGVGDCHEAPLEDGGNRLVGFDGPAPNPDPLPTQP
jgi:hypothetical protein